MSTSSADLDHTPETPSQSLDLDEQLKTLFGFEEFQPGQRPVIESVISGAPTLAVMPTGAGKSLCYQLPAASLDGVTLVISPLISLMKDQVDSLKEREISAAFLNSTLTASDQKEVIYQMERGAYKLIYVAPERFQHQHFISTLKRINISLIAVDEAHCISRWGHNFRPHYARLGDYLAELNPPRVLACTATATPRVSADIVNTLRFQNARTHIAGFLRENLYLEARLCNSERSRHQQFEAFLTQMLDQGEGAVVVYSTTVKRVEKYAQICVDLLGDEHVVMYHGRLPNRKRQSAQERFMDGSARVVVATNAFGMGVDRADVRAVVHIDLPGTLEGYYQEVGRAGRDRKPAHCLLLYMQADARTHQFLISRSNPSPEHLQEVWNTLRDQATQDPDCAYSIENLEEKFKRSQEPIDTPLRHFKTAQIIRVDSWSNTIEVNTNYLEINDVYQLPIDVQTLEQQRDHELQNLDKMLHFAQSSICRHTYLLQYFGEGAEGSCPQGARCDRCEPSSAAYRSSTQATGELSEDERRITLKALSGVARAKGVYGQTRVIEMLSGSNSARFQETFLKDLSTYGILTHLGADACKELIGILVSAGFCILAPRILRNGEVSKYKSLQITPEGLKVMSGRADPTFRLERSWVQLEHQSHGKSHQSKPQPQSRSKPSRSSTHKSSWASKSRSSESSTTRNQSKSTTAKSSKSWRASVSSTAQSKSSSATSQSIQSKRATATSSDEPSGLREELRRYRLSQARLREIPPFAVFSDAVLDALVDDYPQSQQSFLAVRGLGPAKWAQYGSDILEIISNHTV